MCNGQMNANIKFKICCIKNETEAQMAIDAGAYAIGLVSEMPSGPGVISEKMIAGIAKTVPSHIKTFLLTSLVTAKEIIDQYQRVLTTTIQLVDSIETDDYKILRSELPGVELVQVIHVLDENSIKEAVQAAEYVDAVLLDSGNPNLSTKQLGGTGKIHNWELSRQIAVELDIPVFLAGGLNPNNVSDAIEKVRPFGVDICSGVRTDGSLDKVKLDDFAKQIISLQNS